MEVGASESVRVKEEPMDQTGPTHDCVDYRRMCNNFLTVNCDTIKSETPDADGTIKSEVVDSPGSVKDEFSAMERQKMLKPPCKATKLVKKILNSQSRQIVENVLLFMESEANKYRFVGGSIPIAKTRERCSEATGISISTIRRIRAEKKIIDAGEGPSKFKSPKKTMNRSRPKATFDDTEKGTIRRTIHGFITERKTIPSIKKLIPILKIEIGYKGDRETLRKVLRELGFTWKRTRSNKAVLVEKNDIRRKRIDYLDEMRVCRQSGRPIVYLDGTCIVSQTGQRLIILHAGGEAGFVPNALVMWKVGLAKGDYDDRMNHQNYERWVKENLVPNLETDSVLVIEDNAPYHLAEVEKVPSSSATKEQMVVWLRQKGIQFHEEMYKTQLYELIRTNRPKKPRYIIDELLAEHGHTVVRSPPCHPDFNPLKMIWSKVKSQVKSQNVQKISDQQRLCKEKFEEIDTNVWRSFCDRVKKLEDEYRAKEHILDSEFDRIIHSLGSADSSSESETETESDDNDD